MNRTEASEQIREHCITTGLAVMRIHPLLNALGDDATKGEIVRALYEVTKNIEVVKNARLRWQSNRTPSPANAGLLSCEVAGYRG